MNERPTPKFKRGQVVVIKTMTKQPPFRILSVKWEEGWYYQWDRKNYASESMLRELTLDEKG